MNVVSTKPVRHCFGKVSTEEVRQGLSGQRLGLGLLEGSGCPPLVGSEESASLSWGDLTTPPEVGAGTLEVSTCDLKPWGREGKARSRLTHALRGVLVHCTGRSQPHPSRTRGYRTVRMDNWKPKQGRTKPKLNSCGSYFHQRIDSDQEGKKKNLQNQRVRKGGTQPHFQRGNRFSKVDQFSLYTVFAGKKQKLKPDLFIYKKETDTCCSVL